MGWTARIGVEYTITNNWNTFAEYGHVGVPARTALFPTVGVISTIGRSADLFKMGVN